MGTLREWEGSVPGPGLDLIGDEEIAEVTDAVSTRQPVTDALLAHSMSIGIGIVDPNLGLYELRATDDTEAALRCAERFRDAAAPVQGG